MPTLFARSRISKADAQRIRDAIAAAERGHRGEIRVHIEDRYPGDGPINRAQELFYRLGMFRTVGGTAVLLYVAERDHKAAVFAGRGLYGAREPGFWKEVCDLVADGYRRDAPADGLVAAIARIGEVLETLATGHDQAGNELADEVTTS